MKVVDPRFIIPAMHLDQLAGPRYILAKSWDKSVTYH